ncbi:hypothetical protein [Rhodoferax sp.]|uniref:hypothetical protein n=1 Tax=Rhodoferax sp. TaxID=50421 RepID=UPI0025EA4EEB|nr:hypothetical protein [Rhodoferax sp.]
MHPFALKEMKMEKDDEPKTWVSALKIVAALAAVIGTIGFGLWYASQLPVSSPALEQAIEEVRKKSPSSGSGSDSSWGIAKDSPLRR